MQLALVLSLLSTLFATFAVAHPKGINAARMARGLPPLRPRHLYGSRTATARQSTVSPAFDAIANGGMESKGTSWTISGFTSWSTYKDYAHTGSGSLSLLADGDKASQSLVDLVPGANYQLDLWISPLGLGSAACTLTGTIDGTKIFSYDRPGMSFGPTVDYSEHSSTPYTAGPTQTTATLLLSYTCPFSDKRYGSYGSIYLDDIKLTLLL